MAKKYIFDILREFVLLLTLMVFCFPNSKMFHGILPQSGILFSHM